MIEKTILDFLNDNFSVPAYMERPIDPPQKYILLERTGGTLSNVVIGNGVFAVQTYAGTMLEAAELANAVVAKLDTLRESDEVSKVDVDGIYNFTDTDTKDYRYQVVVHVVYYHE